jgi:hypothetical protein
MEHEGKYFRNQEGWIIGPLVPHFDKYKIQYIDVNTSTRYNENLEPSSIYTSPLELNPITFGDLQEVEKLEVGQCVSYNGSFWFVTRVDWSEAYLCGAQGLCYWVSRHGKHFVCPELALSLPRIDHLEGKWVYSSRAKDYIKVSEPSYGLRKPSEGFYVYVEYLRPGSRYTNSEELGALGLDETKILDKHPREENLVREVQGTGEYMYAKHWNSEDYFIVTPSDYYGDYYFAPVGKVFDLFIRNLNSSRSEIWWEFDIFRCDSYPFPTTFSAKHTEKALKEVATYGTNDLQNWLLERGHKDAAQRAIWHRAKMASNTRGNIALYLNESQLESGKIQSLRPGRALRVLIPGISDADLEKLVDAFRKDFPVGDYSLKRGFAAEDFKHMYGHAYATMQNPRTTSARKSLANSCMRHDFSNLPHHPAEAYASGEFEALWSETPEGRIASRLVVWHPPEGHKLHGKPQCGPVYGTCEYSIDLLQDAAVAMGATLYDAATWQGAKWQKLPHNGGVIAPYSDHEQCLEDCGNHLLLGGDCDFEASDYSGVLGASGESCYECGDRIDTEYDSYEMIEGGCYCEHCRDRYFFWCNDNEEYYRHSSYDSYTVHRVSYWGSADSYTVCEIALDSYTLCVDDDEYWLTDDVTFLANGDAISPNGKKSGDYASDYDTDEWYPVEDMYPLKGGGYIAKDNFNETTHAISDDGEVYEREAA